MKPTSWRTLVGVAVVAAALGWAVVSVWKSWTGAPPTVPWTAPLTMGALAAGFALAAISLRPRLRREAGHKPLDPFTAARTAVLAMAGSRAGAFLVGGYLGYGGYLLADLSTSFRRSLLWPVGASVFTALALTLAALWLERVCRIHTPHDDDQQAKPA